jgi:omega-6 fatty acid desaturase (delta-12 desaturase)
MQTSGVEETASEGSSWRQRLASYQRPSAWRGTYELAVTALPLALAWVGLSLSLRFGLYALYAALTPLAAVFLVRLFMIQHDCGHGAFFPNAVANAWLGRLIGIFTMTPYDHWRRSHAIHHATSGNLDRRGIGDIKTMTVEEYRGSSFGVRLRYRLYRHPAVMFLLGPAYVFLLENRLPVGFMRKGWAPWASSLSTNLGIAVFVVLMGLALGWLPFVLIEIPVTVLAATLGVWLFYVQHQFDPTHWARNPEWTGEEAALHGSSYYDLPPVLRWLTANIGLHHIHHLSSRIPYYRLGDALRDHPALTEISRIGVIESLRCSRLSLWDEAAGRMISFREERLAKTAG